MHCRNLHEPIPSRCRRVAIVVVAATAVLLVVCAAGPAYGAAASDAAYYHDLRVSPDLHEILQIPEHGRTLTSVLVLLQLATILIAAKVLGWLAERIRVPGVIGELFAGVLIGPYLLGSMVQLPLHGNWIPLFPPPSSGQWPLNEINWSIAQFASIVLLFVTGLHTDLKQFLRYLGPASLIAVVGVVAPFLLGIGAVYIPAFGELARADAQQPLLIPALFIGAILTATSIGITARVLGDIDQLDSPEGVTILGAAVLDDVLGIIALAIVGGMAAAASRGSHISVSWAEVAWIGGKAIGIWIGLTLLTLALAKPIERLFGRINYAGATVGLSLALAFICSAAAELFGLAFIIGAYSVGLGLSRVRLAHKLMEELRPVYDFMVPVFFASLGMLVDFRAMFSDYRVLAFGLVVTVAAIVGKLLGCGAASLPSGFNMRGAYRIGLGMMPRGEVALIVAGIGLSRGIIGREVFGVSIMMTLITTILAPILLVPAFAKGGSGRRWSQRAVPGLPTPSALPGLAIVVPEDLREPLLSRLLRIAERHGWEAEYERVDTETYLFRREGYAATIRLESNGIRIDASDARQSEIRAFFEQAKLSIVADVTRSGIGAQAGTSGDSQSL